MAKLSSHETLRTEFSGGWLRIVMDDEKRRNALSLEMTEALSSVLEEAADARDVRGISLTGAGGVFCSGGDLKGMARYIFSGDRDAIEEMSKTGGRLFRQLAEQPQPVLALVDGPAMAGGLGLVCCADIVAVTENAKFALTESQLGIPPAQIAPYVVRRLGLITAKRLMITAQKFRGGEAEALGLADTVVKDEAGLRTYEAVVKAQVLTCAPDANAMTKRLALLAAGGGDLSDEAARAFTDCLLSDEGREGIASFVEKRQPSWRQDG